MIDSPILDLTESVPYHHGQFPPTDLNTSRLIKSLSAAAAALARYDQMLKSMHNSEILLAPLRNQEAVVSSRMEGTVSTLDEVLRYEADKEEGNPENGHFRSEAVEVYLYGRAVAMAQQALKEGAPISAWLIRSAHKVLLGWGRGANMAPGEFKTEQNYLADRARRRVMFTPISPELLTDGIEKLTAFIADGDVELLIRTALTHVEFEALHPFKDGNGRIGRMLITLMLWRYGAISAPHFYISGYFEEHRDEYVDRMREVSRSGAWTDWIIFFLVALEDQANRNLERAEAIGVLYGRLKGQLRELLSSQWSTTALDFLFSRPIFRNNVFTTKSGIPAATAHRFTRILVESGLIHTLEPASGRRPALYSFEPLLELVRG